MNPPLCVGMSSVYDFSTQVLKASRHTYWWYSNLSDLIIQGTTRAVVSRTKNGDNTGITNNFSRHSKNQRNRDHSAAGRDKARLVSRYPWNVTAQHGTPIVSGRPLVTRGSKLFGVYISLVLIAASCSILVGGRRKSPGFLLPKLCELGTSLRSYFLFSNTADSLACNYVGTR